MRVSFGPVGNVWLPSKGTRRVYLLFFSLTCIFFLLILFCLCSTTLHTRYSDFLSSHSQSSSDHPPHVLMPLQSMFHTFAYTHIPLSYLMFYIVTHHRRYVTLYTHDFSYPPFLSLSLVLHVLAYDSHNDLDHAIRFTHDFLNHSHVYCVKPYLDGWSSVSLEATIPFIGRPRCRYVMGGK